ncbi:hypothetical protein SMX26_003603 [Cronobacter universalis]|nr:hypothetical protein [Cronobacter universalis]
MKAYLINHNCIFTEANNELKNTDNACVIKMTTMRARCLSFIIENAKNGVIEKQQIAAVLWGNRGQFISDANLTQVLYLLRRDLRALWTAAVFAVFILCVLALFTLTDVSNP